MTCIFQNWSFKISSSFSKSWKKAQKSPFHLSKPSKSREVLGGATEFGGERWEDPIVKPALVAQGGQIVWDPNPPRWGQVEKGRVISKDVGVRFLVAYFFLPLNFGLLTSPKKSKYGRSAAGPLRVLPPMVMAWVVLVVLRQRPCQRQRRPMRSLHGSRTGHQKQNPQDDFHWEIGRVAIFWETFCLENNRLWTNIVFLCVFK